MADHPLLIAAGRFHGHIGPFLAVGLKMGLLANEKMGRAPLETKAIVTVQPSPPRSCVVDGIQYAAGCTMGKGNIEIQADAGLISAQFVRGSRSLVVKLLDDCLQRIETDLEGASRKAVVDYAFQMMDTPPERIFEVSL